MGKTTGPAAGRQERTVQLLLPVAEQMREGLREFVVSAGLKTLAALLEAERTELCGPRYRHDSDRRAHRAGSAPGELVMGGRRVSVKRPRARSVEGREVPLPTWEEFSAADPLEERAVEQMVLGVATRKYARSLEPVGDGVRTRGAGKSAVSRRFVRKTAEAMDAFLARDLGKLDLAALMVDGVHFADHVVLVALGIDAEGNKHVLGLWEGATENSAAVEKLLADLVGRGLRTDRSLLAVIDGAKALAKAVHDVFGKRVLLQRCQVHKRRNVAEHLPESKRAWVGAQMSAAWGCGDAAKAKKLLTALAGRLEDEHPGAAASLREGLSETLTVMGLGLPAALARTLNTTNPIENLIGRARDVARRVKRWRGGKMILRWTAAAMTEADKGFRRLKGHRGLPKLLAALRANDERIAKLDKEQQAA